MKNGFLLIVIGIFIAYLGVSGKYACFTKFLKCIAGADDCGCGNSTAKASPGLSNAIPELKKLNPLPTLK